MDHRHHDAGRRRQLGVPRPIARLIAVHDRVCVSGISSWNQSLADDLVMYRDLGVLTFGLALRKLSAPGDVDIVVASELRVGNVIGVGTMGLADALGVANQVGAPALVLTTGPAGALEWEDAARMFGEVVAPFVDNDADVRILLEHTNSLRADVGFVHSLRDAVDVARDNGLGVCMEINACWGERGLRGTIADSMDVITVVQVSDYAVGTKSTPDRLVPGDGDIPIERIVATVLDAGYPGMFDIELVGPRIEAEGYRSAISRSCEWLSKLLERLGA
jgi:sugar phosphate isomerase/epimerase